MGDRRWGSLSRSLVSHCGLSRRHAVEEFWIQVSCGRCSGESLRSRVGGGGAQGGKMLKRVLALTMFGVSRGQNKCHGNGRRVRLRARARVPVSGTTACDGRHEKALTRGCLPCLRCAFGGKWIRRDTGKSNGRFLSAPPTWEPKIAAAPAPESISAGPFLTLAKGPHFQSRPRGNTQRPGFVAQQLATKYLVSSASRRHRACIPSQRCTALGLGAHPHGVSHRLRLTAEPSRPPDHVSGARVHQ